MLEIYLALQRLSSYYWE